MSTKIILIFDECTSGFRETFGGIHKKFGVNPDMAMFGKALETDMQLLQLLEKSEIMDAAQKPLLVVLFGLKELVQVLH